MRPGVCPHCGQRILIRHGAQLSPKLADIFDAIAGAGARGISFESLRAAIYPDVPNDRAATRLKALIWHLDQALAGTEVYVAHARGEPYRFVDFKKLQEMRKAAAKVRRMGGR
ncbi:MAG TPA: hypothetical protein VGH47_00075 [Xanthobacteraceae bacterium]|jgi:uncharacterized protein YtpQ (UPF0354 family)